MASFFENFPTTVYANVLTVNINKRIGILPSVESNPYAFAPYDMSAGERADTTADLYYDSEERDWLVWISNGVLDPYHQWYLDDADFNAFIIKKYGSIEAAQNKIKYWEANWGVVLDLKLNADQYGALDDNVKPYYEPHYANNDPYKILYWVRREDDWRVTTNMVISGQYTAATNTPFKSGDMVVLPHGMAEVCWSNNTVVRMQHVRGFLPDDYLNGVTLTSYANSAFSLSITGMAYTSNVIPVELRPLFEPVSYYDQETYDNEQYKSITLIDKKYTYVIESELKTVLK